MNDHDTRAACARFREDLAARYAALTETPMTNALGHEPDDPITHLHCERCDKDYALDDVCVLEDIDGNLDGYGCPACGEDLEDDETHTRRRVLVGDKYVDAQAPPAPFFSDTPDASRVRLVEGGHLREVTAEEVALAFAIVRELAEVPNHPSPLLIHMLRNKARLLVGTPEQSNA